MSGRAFPAIVLAVVGVVGACGGEDSAAPRQHQADGGDAGELADSANESPSPDVSEGATGTSYDQDGTVPYTTEVQQVTNGSSTFNVTVYLPTSPGLLPVVSFSCGSTQTAAGYVPYGQRLASHGIAMLLTDDPGIFVNTADIVPNAVYVVDTWLPATFAEKLDSTRVGLGGHSRGGAVSLLAAEHGLKGKVVAWFGLDPVDNQFLMTPGQFARTDLPQIGIPTAYLGAEVISNCAPAADGYSMLYPLSPSPSALVIGLGAGHTQFELASGCTGCGICTPAGTADDNVVLAYALRYFTAFFARELLGDTGVGAAFEGVGAPADIAAGRVSVESK